MKLVFTKMQGAGNDFVVIDGVTQAVDLSTAQLKRIADRRRGIGCDQILLLTPPMIPTPIFATPSITPTVPALVNAVMAHGAWAIFCARSD